MTRHLIAILAFGLTAATLCPADAATRKVRIPNRYDGSWTIVASTTGGPCASSTRYRVDIKDGEASVSGREVDINGGVSANGAVQATIVQGSNTVPIMGHLDRKGHGTGTWRTTGSLVTCNGNWSAERTG